MASRSSNDGSGEIEANKKLLEATELNLVLAGKNLVGLKKELVAEEGAFKIAENRIKSKRLQAEQAKELLENAEAKRKDAMECLDAAKKKWESNCIDEGGGANREPKSTGSNNRKQKAIPSVQGETNPKKRAKGGGDFLLAEAKGDNDNVRMEDSRQSTAKPAPTQTLQSKSSSKKPRVDVPDEVVVEGCGFSEVNGVYKKCYGRYVKKGL